MGSLEKNKGGRRKKDPRGEGRCLHEERELILERAADAAVKFLMDVVSDESADLKLRLGAANDLLERASPKQETLL